MNYFFTPELGLFLVNIRDCRKEQIILKLLMSFPIPGHFIINFTSKRDQKRVLERRFGFNNPLKTSLRLAKKMKR